MVQFGQRMLRVTVALQHPYLELMEKDRKIAAQSPIGAKGAYAPWGQSISPAYKHATSARARPASPLYENGINAATVCHQVFHQGAMETSNDKPEHLSVIVLEDNSDDEDAVDVAPRREQQKQLIGYKTGKWSNLIS
ncbi:hypothetical protein CYMTET_14402 [Cymbomonas tetramitiformis]|uniref:Uncharacterized protein n=1 Tax=Cymbomonas tetramitiformis TaxID=36881 RepID=A0AAE0GG18_9CHLO|nr:hypothetical protein CYMTET_14402 [Cymbomonas tetramitiformis]